jgi:hypothetical protein
LGYEIIMKIINISALILASSIILVIGCSTLPPPHSIPPDCVTFPFSGTINEAFEIARSSLMANGITPLGGSPELGFVSGERGASAFSWGELVAVYFEEQEKNTVIFWVVSKPKLATNITAPDHAGEIFVTISALVKQHEKQHK